MARTVKSLATSGLDLATTWAIFLGTPTYGVRSGDLEATTAGAEHLQMNVLSIVLETHWLGGEELHCGNGKLLNINDDTIRNKWNEKNALLAAELRIL